MDTKFCSRCGQEKPISEFYRRRVDTSRNKAGELIAWCKCCRLAYKRAWHARNKEKDNEHKRAYYRQNDECIKLKARAGRQQLKQEVIAHYSKGSMRCPICGIDDIVVLCIDHIDGNGQAHRRAIGRTSGAGFYQWLIQNNYPVGFQVLCYNCNMRKRWEQLEYGVRK